MNALIQLSLVHQCVHRLCVLCKSLNRYALPHVPCSYKRMHAHTETLCRAVCLDSTAWCWALHEHAAHAYTSVSMFRERAREREREFLAARVPKSLTLDMAYILAVGTVVIVSLQTHARCVE